jgi:signal transduction histidine kinase
LGESHRQRTRRHSSRRPRRRAGASRGSAIAVRIVDNGAGIPPAIRDRIFDPFFTTKPVGLGTGLGLDIVRRLVRHNNGEIAVESQPGRTEFRVVLPAAEDERAERTS